MQNTHEYNPPGVDELCALVSLPDGACAEPPKRAVVLRSSGEAQQLLGQHWPLIALDYAPVGSSRVTDAPGTAISDTEPMRT